MNNQQLKELIFNKMQAVRLGDDFDIADSVSEALTEISTTAIHNRDQLQAAGNEVVNELTNGNINEVFF